MVAMKHDELLAKIDESIKAAEFEERWMWTTNANALRVVVELHREITLITGYSHDKTYELRQQVCINCTDLTVTPTQYPCFTIQAIEKELR
jgi:hypothetical protein